MKIGIFLRLACTGLSHKQRSVSVAVQHRENEKITRFSFCMTQYCGNHRCEVDRTLLFGAISEMSICNHNCRDLFAVEWDDVAGKILPLLQRSKQSHATAHQNRPCLHRLKRQTSFPLWVPLATAGDNQECVYMYEFSWEVEGECSG
jgi:hypothetical protein